MALNSRIPSGPIQDKWDKHRFEMKLVNPANKRKYTVLVVGSGLAGASAIAIGDSVCETSTPPGSKQRFALQG